MKKRLISFILMLAMSIAILSPVRVGKVQAAEVFSNWAITDLLLGDTYGIYPLSWYEKDLTDSISKDQFRVLLYGLRRKLVETNVVKESRSAKALIKDSITVREALEAFYTVLSNYDYPINLGIEAGNDAVSFMMQMGVYTGKGGEQSLDEICSVEQAMVIASRIVMVFYETLGASSKGFLWEVKSDSNTVYLLGSIHLASTDLYPLSKKIWMAFINSNELVVEANLYDQNDQLSLMNLVTYTDGTTLKDHISAETYQNVVAAAQLMGYTEEMVALIKPWGLYLIFTNISLLNTSAGEDATAQLGVDANLMANALIYQKPIMAIEGLTKQGQIFESLSAGLQEYLLNTYSTQLSAMVKGEANATADEMDDSVEAMYKSWKEGDVEAFAKLSQNSGMEEFAGELTDEVKKYAEEYTTKLLVQRDDAMAEYIINLLKSEKNSTYFVVLGALHFISEYDVIDRLTKAGYVVEQIK